MEYFWISYEGVSTSTLSKLFDKNNIFVIRECGASLLVTSSLGADQIKELIWESNDSLYCEVTKADYEDIEEYL